MPDAVVELRKTATEELARWALEIGITPDALASELVRVAIPGLKKAICDTAKPDSNVLAFALKR
ncbi:hypothetical protein [Pseudomonas fluorescens]|uniref:hypothetical protein n=1 Tax=Pseudomonas fluorescens TaxID=294 RepID=UPI0012424E18|nr:hypothetical protein [Pseudomonas fluorescens]VVN46900.1 hypothetical protein PS676_05829 [Pseudomonas fluorescens]